MDGKIFWAHGIVDLNKAVHHFHNSGHDDNQNHAFFFFNLNI